VDFSLTREQEMVKNMVREFAEKELAPRTAMLDAEGGFPVDLVPRLVQLGLIGIGTPREYGGSGMGYMARMLAVEELARVYPALAFFYVTNEEVMFVLQIAGTEEQKRKYLVPMCKGEKLACYAVTEASGGSHPASMQTTAEPVDDGFVVNGRKVFITMGGAAHLCLLVARTGDKFNSFIVEKGTPGFEVGRRESIAGLRAMPVNELIFTNCRLPRESLIGEEGTGLSLALTDFTLYARPGMSGVALGVARGAYEAALKFARERKLYGAPIAELQAIQFALADMETQVEAAKWLYYHVCWLIEQGKSSREVNRDVARTKIYTTETAVRVCLKAMQIMGGYGVTEEYNVVRRLNDALAFIPAGGTSEIMRVTLAREILR
jgi:butyryl-CoA dehydrogenase